jgi:hypothetical protein
MKRGRPVPRTIEPEDTPAAQSSGVPTARDRSTLTVADDRRSMTALWERTDDGTSRQPWMHIAFARDHA